MGPGLGDPVGVAVTSPVGTAASVRAADACPTPRPARSTTTKVTAATATTTTTQPSAMASSGRRRIPHSSPSTCPSVPTVAHVLVIEDDPAIRSSLVRSLTERGHAVSSAPAGMPGLQNALDEQPDLVLLDLGLPDLDGHSLLTMLRAVRRTPVIVVTARDDDPSIVKALDAGADDYVVKPFGDGPARGADPGGAAPHRRRRARRADHGR